MSLEPLVVEDVEDDVDGRVGHQEEVAEMGAKQYLLILWDVLRNCWSQTASCEGTSRGGMAKKIAFCKKSYEKCSLAGVPPPSGNIPLPLFSPPSF